MSFFGGGSKANTSDNNSSSPSTTNDVNPTQYDTGHNVDDIVKGLIISINDENTTVQEQIHKSLIQIGQVHELLVLNKCLYFLNVTCPKSNKKHRVLIMNVMSELLDKKADEYTCNPDINPENLTNEETCKLKNFPEKLANQLVDMSIHEMVSEKSINSEWQTSASKLIISLSRYVPNIVSFELLDNFPLSAQQPPHYFVIKTFMDFAFQYPKLFINNLKEILTRTLPLLAMIKHDNLRWVICAALGRFSEALIYCFKENLINDLTPYNQPFLTVLKHILQEWLNLRETKIRLAAAQSIGYMFKKEMKEDPLPITIGLQNLIEVIIKKCSTSLNEYLNNILSVLFTHLIVTVSRLKSYKNGLRNINEILQTFSIICNGFSDQLISFIQQQLEIPNSSKVCALKVLRYLIKHNDTDLSSYKDVIVSGLIKILKDPNLLEDLEIHYEFICVILEMSKRLYLNAHGSHELVLVIMRGCALNEKRIETNYNQNNLNQIMKCIENEQLAVFDGKDEFMEIHLNQQYQLTNYQLREKSDEIMTLFTTELGEIMDPVLWPFLLELFVQVSYDNAFSMLCKSIADISKRKKNDDDFIIDFESQVNIPKPNYLFARCLIKLTLPFIGRNQPGTNILRAMYCLSPNIHPDLVPLWSKKLPQMKKYIEQNVNLFNQDEWENQLLNLVRESIDTIQDDKWAVSLGEALLEQCNDFYKNSKLLKKNCLSIIGLIIQKSQLKQFIHSAVERSFKLTDHSVDEERLGCARGLGQASAAHTDVVLTHLQNVIKGPEKKTGLFARNTGKEVTPQERATALLAYGYVSMLTPLNLLTSRVEVHIIKNMIPVLTLNNNSVTITYDMKENGLRAIDLIGKSVHPSRLNDFTLKSRDELIRLVLSLMSGPITTQNSNNNNNNNNNQTNLNNLNKLRVLGLEAINTLVQLPPKIEIEKEILNETLNYMKIQSGDFDLDDLLIDHLNNLLYSILHTDNSQGTLDDLLKEIENGHLNSTLLIERERACNAYVLLLKDYAKIISENHTSLQNNKNNSGNALFMPLGRIVGQLIPRITEQHVPIRKFGLDGIYLVLRIHYYLINSSSNNNLDALPEYIEKLGSLREILFESDQQLKVAKEISQILCEALNDKQYIINLLDTLLDTLNDPEQEGANGSCIVLNGIILKRGNELKDESSQYVKKMIKLIPNYKELIVSGLLHGIRGFTRHFPLQMINTILLYQVPHTEEVKKCFKVLSNDNQLNQFLLDQLIDILNNAQLFEEKRIDNNLVEYIPTPLTISATQALYEIMELNSQDEDEEEEHELIMENYAKVCMTCLLRIGTANEMTVNPPTKYAQQVVEQFYKVAVLNHYKINNQNNNNNGNNNGDDENDNTPRAQPPQALSSTLLEQLVQKAKYGDAIQQILELIVKRDENQIYIKDMFEFIKSFISRTFIGQRVVATCIVSVLLKYVKNNREIVHDMINCLLSRSGTDEKVNVKLFALRGLSNLSLHTKEILHQYVTPVTGALLSNLEDPNQQVILEAMNSVKQIISIAQDEYISPLLMNLCVRLKPSFEKKDSAPIRESSIRLFGALYRYTDGVMRDTLINTIFNNLPIFLCHINDPEEKVSHACKYALKCLIPTLKSQPLLKIFMERDAFSKVTEEKNSPKLNIDEFAPIFAKVWIQEFPDRISDFVMNLVVFYKSEWHACCAAACLFIGHILANLSQEQKQRVNLRHTCQGLIDLLKSPSTLVREKVSTMLGLLFEA
ncbi:hypothetical protein ABK040_008008 [Willaertia magna]